MALTAVITGASGGIGLELAREFARDGYDLVLVARSEDKLRTLARELGARGITAHVLPLDLSDYRRAREVYAFCRTRNLEVAFLVNNAGFGDFRFFQFSNWEKQERMINLNITALTYLTRLFLPDLVSRGAGRILHVASTAA
ncbi:MAG TPA: SDR family NAD(P)-dependent oxidoreductase, partial [Chitinophagaceae bacterium]|nr:SDR family NAD(P)-dependent oxidoreductase [Chitinophagaceae bacterium]